MSNRRNKVVAANSDTPPKVHVYLLVPPVLHEWLQARAEAGGFKNVQDKILDVLRTAREAEQQQEQAA
jgi:hypothetical protein